MARQTKKERQSERDESIARLRKLLKPGDTVYVACSHVARSGMSRRLRLFVVRKGEIQSITCDAARAVGWRLKDGWHWEIVIPGCGMDMGFHAVYSLARTLFPNGGPLRKSNATRQHQETARGKTRETDGGYLLKHHWI